MDRSEGGRARIARKLLNRIRYVLKNEQPYVEAVLETA
jgi:hypothetical protein